MAVKTSPGGICSQFKDMVGGYISLGNMTSALCISAITTLEKGSNGTVKAAPVELGEKCYVSRQQGELRKGHEG